MHYKGCMNIKQLLVERLLVVWNEKWLWVIARIKVGVKIYIYAVTVKRKVWDEKYDGKTGGKKFKELGCPRSIKIPGGEKKEMMNDDIN